MNKPPTVDIGASAGQCRCWPVPPHSSKHVLVYLWAIPVALEQERSLFYLASASSILRNSLDEELMVCRQLPSDMVRDLLVFLSGFEVREAGDLVLDRPNLERPSGV